MKNDMYKGLQRLLHQARVIKDYNGNGKIVSPSFSLGIDKELFENCSINVWKA